MTLWTSHPLGAVSADDSPTLDSKNQVDAIDLHGQSMPGFPIEINGFPQQHAPVLDTVRQRAYVLVQTTGEVDGFDLANGRRLAGFPSRVPGLAAGSSVRSMVFHRPWDGLAIATGRTELIRLDGSTGKAVQVPVYGAMRLSALATLGNGLAVIDDLRGQIALVDSGGRVTNAVSLPARGLYRESYLLQWFVSLAHARTVIETWRQGYNDERPKRSLGGLTPAQYAKQLAARPIKMPENSKSACYCKRRDVGPAAASPP